MLLPFTGEDHICALNFERDHILCKKRKFHFFWIFGPLYIQCDDFAEALVGLGQMYRDGQGIDPDSSESVKWCHKAAEQNHVTAQHKLGYASLRPVTGPSRRSNL